MQFFGWTLADRHAGNELPQYSADRQAGDGAELPEPLTLHFGEPHRYHVFLIRPFSAPFCGSMPRNFPPAGGIGDWGDPQQARLSYKRYACASAAIGGVGFRPAARGFVFKWYGNCNIGRALPASS